MRRAAIVVAVAAVVATALPTPARAGTFRFSQCNAVDQGGSSPRGYQAALWSYTTGWPTVDCGTPGGSIRVLTANFRLLDRWDQVSRLALPPSMPATSMRAAWIDWTFPGQAPSTNPAYLAVASSGALIHVANPGEGTWPGAARRYNVPVGARDLEWRIWCSPANGPGWCNWSGYMLVLRGMTFELDEEREPSASAAGDLLAGGPRAGVEPLEVEASDGDSGVRRVGVLLGGTSAGSLEPADGCRDDRLPPCPQSLRGTVDVDTRAVPDGPQRLRLVVTDAAGNTRTVDAGTVMVANQPRTDTPAPGAPLPGTAPASGGSTGGRPPGAPGSRGAAPFPPNPLAGRGHAPNGTGATVGAHVAAWLELPVRDHIVRRRAVVVPFGVRVRVRGRLTNRHGRPIAGAALAAIRRRPRGRWRITTGVRTRRDGRFTTFTRIGRSEELRFVYYPYGDSTVGARSTRLRVTVRRH